MSQMDISIYLKDLEQLKRVSGHSRETIVREAFKDLLKRYSRRKGFYFITEYAHANDKHKVDGAVLWENRLPLGYWEAKDEEDNIDEEISAKFRIGYPRDNIIFEDTREAILIQNSIILIRCSIDDTHSLSRLLEAFFAFEPPEISAFKKAIEQFSKDLPAILAYLREAFDNAITTSKTFAVAVNIFLEHVRSTVNHDLEHDDIREMMIQHILMDDVFEAIFPGQPFHKENNIAKELQKLQSMFFHGNTMFQVSKLMSSYYCAIRGASAHIESHHEKQNFLKTIYEGFYRTYDPDAADRLGIVYTPNEIVSFMVESTDWLCEKHFGKRLIDQDVDILDPATGTGTYICELLNHFSGNISDLKWKYLNELHANEIAILPYYVANLNIEASYSLLCNEYSEFNGLCLVDTLDLEKGVQKQEGDFHADLFGALTEENADRIRRQGSRKISVVIGNPPYNCNQKSFNERNANRPYPNVDKRIRDTYLARSKAQKTKVYDMYTRFLRWSTDRLGQNGIIAFITNRSFLEGRSFDGFRSVVSSEFDSIYIIDLGGDVRLDPRLSGPRNSVFSIQTGVAICFWVRVSDSKKGNIYYAKRPALETADDKLSYLSKSNISNVSFEKLHPDKNANWINVVHSDYDSLVPLLPDDKDNACLHSVFSFGAKGISTNKDEWVYDLSNDNLEAKMRYMIDVYNKTH